MNHYLMQIQKGQPRKWRTEYWAVSLADAVIFGNTLHCPYRVLFRGRILAMTFNGEVCYTLPAR